VLSHAVLVTSMPSWWDRASVSAALGIGLAVVAVTVRSLVVPGVGVTVPALTNLADPSPRQTPSGENP
jgi:hypothetical protein